MSATLHDFWFWSFWLMVLVLVGADRIVRAYRKLADDAISEMEESTKLAEDFARRAEVPQEVHDRGWQWRPVSDDTAFAPPFSTVRACIDCGCLVAGGPTRCGRCAKDVTP